MSLLWIVWWNILIDFLFWKCFLIFLQKISDTLSQGTRIITPRWSKSLVPGRRRGMVELEIFPSTVQAQPFWGSTETHQWKVYLQTRLTWNTFTTKIFFFRSTESFSSCQTRSRPTNRESNPVDHQSLWTSRRCAGFRHFTPTSSTSRGPLSQVSWSLSDESPVLLKNVYLA